MLLDLSGFFRIYITRGQTEHGEVSSVLKSSVYSLCYLSCQTIRRHKTITFLVLVQPSNILLYNPGQALSAGQTLMGYWLRPNIQVHGTTAHSGPGPPHYRGFTITFSQTRHIRKDSSGRVISPTQKPVPAQYSQETDIHASGGIRTRNPTMRAAEDPCLRPRGRWDPGTLNSQALIIPECRGEFRPRQTRQLPRAVDLKGRLLSCQSY